jgi:poly(A) polymerase
VAPSFCRRSDFFGLTNATDSGSRDPDSLAERIRKHPDVENFVAVDTAAVPILTFDWSGINIDLLFARVNTNSVPPNFDIDNDGVLDGADGATEKSLNGPRVTNLIAMLVSGTPERYQMFLTVVRCVRKWAKVRGLYSNKMGYWGGVNINIGVALTIQVSNCRLANGASPCMLLNADDCSHLTCHMPQMYPNACAASLLRKFFLVFKTWRWPQPVMLTKPHDAGYGLPVWTQQGAARQIAPMITPAYPGMNSSLSVSRQTLQILQAEFERGHAIVDSIWKQYNANRNAELDWESLFMPSDFFINYPVCLQRARVVVSSVFSSCFYLHT